MIQLNDSESLVSVLEGFSDHRARALALHTNLVRFPCMGPNPYSGSEGGGWVDGGLGGWGWAEKSKKRFLQYRFVLILRVLGSPPPRPTPPPGLHRTP